MNRLPMMTKTTTSDELMSLMNVPLCVHFAHLFPHPLFPSSLRWSWSRSVVREFQVAVDSLYIYTHAHQFANLSTLITHEHSVVLSPCRIRTHRCENSFNCVQIQGEKNRVLTNSQSFETRRHRYQVTSLVPLHPLSFCSPISRYSRAISRPHLH